MTNDPTFALHRFGLGAKPGQPRDLPTDMRSVLRAALRDEHLQIESKTLRSTQTGLKTFYEFQARRRQGKADGLISAGGGREMKRKQSPAVAIYRAEIDARLKRIREVDVGLLERLTSFWANHFAVSAREQRIRVVAGSFEREAIRPYLKGRFADLLRAVISHPAMLLYLDNNRSVGPNSQLGQRKQQGLNENLARELLELHTLGVNGGYSQEDVTETAKILTGWSFRGAKAKHEPFTYRFLDHQHEPGTKVVLGERYEDAGYEEAVALCDALARHPATAQHIATKLARHFVADDPPKELVDALKNRFLDSNGDLLKVYEALLDHPLSWSPSHKKLRTPQEWLAAALRAFDADMPAPFANKSLSAMGHRLWFPPSPEGYEDRADAWLGGAQMNARLDWAAAFTNRFAPRGEPLDVAEQVLANRLTDETALAMQRAATRQQAFQIMLLAPEMMRR